jgi:DNA-binding transcriptional regulator GbsR (MarR family)
MDDDVRAARRAQFVEDFGVAIEDLGLPRMAGRLLGHLLVCEPPEQSSRDIAGALQASKGSVSSTTRLLIGYGIVDRVARPAERVDYFRIRPGVWTKIMRLRLAQASRIHEVAERGIALLHRDDLAGYARIEELHDFHQFLEIEYQALLERWEQQRAQRAAEEDGDLATERRETNTGGAR